MSETLNIVLLVVAALSAAAAFERFRLRRFSSRRCTGSQWRRKFPQASNAEIRAFLDLILFAFGFDVSKRLSFAPDDQIMSIYRALYPRAPRGADAMELESFVTAVQDRYGVDLLPVWRENITLGELFSHATKQA